MSSWDIDFGQRVDAVNWSDYQTAYGKADTVAEQLKKLATGTTKESITAAHNLWCGLCHQHAFVSSAALPAFPFLLEVLKTANDDLSVELLDIFLGFAICSTNTHNLEDDEVWKETLVQQLINQKPLFQKFSTKENENITYFSAAVLEQLESK